MVYFCVAKLLFNVMKNFMVGKFTKKVVYNIPRL